MDNQEQLARVAAFLQETFGIPAILLEAVSMPEDTRMRMLSRLEKAPPPVQIFLHTYPMIRVGGLYRIKEGASYKLTKPGSLVCITNIRLTMSGAFTGGDSPTVKCMAFDDNGRLLHAEEKFDIAIEHLDPLSRGEAETITNFWKEPVPEQPPLSDGTCVELAQDVTLVFKSFMGTKTMKLQKGMQGIIDTPDNNAGNDTNDANSSEYSSPMQKIEFKWEVANPLSKQWVPDYDDLDANIQRSLRRQAMYIVPDIQHMHMEVPVAGYGWKYQVYFPALRGHASIDQSLLAPRAFDRDALKKLVIDQHSKRKVLAAVSDRRSTKFVLDDTVKKGKGRIIFGAGDPGLGKTLTAEAVADTLGRPLFVIDNRMFGDSGEEFEEGLQKALDTIKRWNAIGLWDECEVYLRSRSNDLEANTRISSALRLLEGFEGVLFMTTNKPQEIDKAILSRSQCRIYYPQFTLEQRRKVWELTIPENFPIKDWETHADELASLPLSGRDIKSVLQNASDIADSEGLDHVPADYLVAEAHDLLGTVSRLEGSNGAGRAPAPVLSAEATA